LNSEEGKRQLELALYRIQQAEESLDEARYLLAGNKSPRSVINRAYYSMFYSILALLIFEPYSSSKHSGVLSYFNLRFIKSGIIQRDIGRAVNKAFDIRQRSDYREQISLNPDQVEPYIDWADRLIQSVRDILKNRGNI
jgi:uncharacterized protein (UPF0332 family)